jgi:hypothetical protein
MKKEFGKTLLLVAKNSDDYFQRWLVCPRWLEGHLHRTLLLLLQR